MRSSIKLGVAIGILTLVSPTAGWYFCPRAVKYNEGFEQDFGGWTGDADVPLDPNNARALKQTLLLLDKPTRFQDGNATATQQL